MAAVSGAGMPAVPFLKYIEDLNAMTAILRGLPVDKKVSIAIKRELQVRAASLTSAVSRIDYAIVVDRKDEAEVVLKAVYAEARAKFARLHATGALIGFWKTMKTTRNIEAALATEDSAIEKLRLSESPKLPVEIPESRRITTRAFIQVPHGSPMQRVELPPKIFKHSGYVHPALRREPSAFKLTS